MPITYDKYTDGLYLEGIEDHRYRLVKNALVKRKFTVEQISEMIEVSTEYVLSVQREIGKG